MMLRLTIAVCISLIPSAVLAQANLPKSPTGHEPFVDETGATVRALAKSAGISEDAARERLQKMVAASSLASTAGAVGVEVRFDRGAAPNVVLYAPAASRDKLASSLRAMSAMANSSTIKVVEARSSPEQLDAMADEVIASAEKQGSTGYVRTDRRTGAMTFVADKKAANRSFAASTAPLKLPYGTAVGDGPEIVKAARSWAGGQFLHYIGQSPCTTGFVGFNSMRGTIERGAITAFHCDGRAGFRGSMDASRSGTYRSPSPISAFVVEYGYSPQQDFMFLRFEDQSANTTVPYFNTGQGSNAIVRGAVDVAWRSTVCKYGVTTGFSCGLVSYSTIRLNGGTYYIVEGDGRLAAGGDSGGPVFQGNLIAGIVYAEYGPTAMLINPYKYISEKTTTIKFSCAC